MEFVQAPDYGQHSLGDESHRYDATHITISTSPLNDDLSLVSMTALMQLMGNLNIRVVEVEH